MRFGTIDELFRDPALDCDLLDAHLAEKQRDLQRAMQLAVARDRLDLLECALRHDPGSWELDSVLHRAAERRGAAAFIRVLLQAGADATIADNIDFPLCAAAGAGDVESLELLLGAGADPNTRHAGYGAPGWEGTPLLAAVCSGVAAAVRVLLDAGADVNVMTFKPTRPLNLAEELGDKVIVDLLRERGAIALGPEDYTLEQAARHGMMARVREALPEASSEERGHALVSALCEKDVAVATAVLEHGEVDPRQLIDALTQCITRDIPEIVPLLIKAGVHRDSTDNFLKSPPIVLAAERGRLPIARALLDAGVDLDARDRDGQNALAAARKEKQAETVRLLEDAGANARTPAQIRKAVERKLAAQVRSSWSPRLGDPASAAGDPTSSADPSRFGGLPRLRDGEAWPACSRCTAPLAFFVQVDLDRVPETARAVFGSGLLQLFCCTDIACAAWVPFAGSHRIRIIDAAEGAAPPEAPAGVRVFPERPITGWHAAVDDYPFGEGGESLLPEEHEEAFALNRQGDKLGGWPNWVQDAAYPRCPEGDHHIDRIILQIDSHRGVPHMWGDNGVAFILQCGLHRDQVAFTWQSG